MSDITKLAVELEQFFLARGYQWVDEAGNKFAPSASQMQQALDNIKESLLALDVDTKEGEYPMIEVGRLYATLRAGYLDVYVHAGLISLED